jgi:hypothetical protein
MRSRLRCASVRGLRGGDWERFFPTKSLAIKKSCNRRHSPVILSTDSETLSVLVEMVADRQDRLRTYGLEAPRRRKTICVFSLQALQDLSVLPLFTNSFTRAIRYSDWLGRTPARNRWPPLALRCIEGIWKTLKVFAVGRPCRMA